TQNPACRFPAPGSPGRTHSRASSDRRMTEFRVRQFKPRAVHEVAPEQPMSLAASAQYSDPLQLYLAPNHVEFRLAVVQPEILIETTQHHGQLTLLIPPLPVPMSREPLLGARQKLSTALLARETDHRELAAVSDSTYMRETQKVKRAGSLVVRCFGCCSEASEEQQPCFLVGQFQVESRESFPQISIEVFRIPLVLETCHKIVSEPKQIGFPSKPISHLLLEPKIEHKVQIGPGFQSCVYILDSSFQFVFELLCRFSVHSACPASVHLLPGLDEKRWCQQMRQRREAKRAVFLGLGRDLFQLCRPPSPTSERRRCFPGSASRPAPPLPLVRGFPA